MDKNSPNSAHPSAYSLVLRTLFAPIVWLYKKIKSRVKTSLEDAPPYALGQAATAAGTIATLQDRGEEYAALTELGTTDETGRE